MQVAIRYAVILAILLTTFVLETKAQAPHATGVESGVVYLNDLEDHNWTYYSGVDRSVDNGNYNDNYKGLIYSPNPRNVMITYKGNGGAVSMDNEEGQGTFVYYKTLECKTVGTGEQAVKTYPYTVISNPFSKRPAGKGFGGWKIISGENYIKRANGETATENAILNLDEAITFINLPYHSTNCISAEIVFEATWIPAHTTYLTSVTTNNSNYDFDTRNPAEGVATTHENNFLVINKEYSGKITVNSPCTIMMVEPDGSEDYRTNNFTGAIVPMVNGNTKIEFAQWNPQAAIDAKGQNFTIGRGMKMNGTKRALYGTNTETIEVNQILKIETGAFNTFTHYYKKPSNIAKQWVTFGCDYDRAKNDNSKLEFTGRPLVASAIDLGQASGKEICRVYGLSGKFLTSKTVADASRNESYYMCVLTTSNKGYRYLEIQGGEWLSIAGGMDENTSTDPGFTFRMKGGHIKGSVYGAAEYLGSSGTRVLVLTGGAIEGWVAGGANGTQESGGKLTGTSYVYVGGNVHIDSNKSQDVINRAVGGNVFGAGCGYASNKNAGMVTLGTNVVIADNAYVERGVYGGGSYGYCAIDKTSNIYITGGTIGGNVGGVNGTSYVSTIKGGVFGGACQNKGGNVNIYMTDGTVNGGIYGGSNASGTLSGNVNMKITGGAIGSSQTRANVYGGGYGSNTIVSGTVNLTLDKLGNKVSTIYGDVYGGGAEGQVKNNISVNVNTTTINGNLYGGGHGTDAVVTGNTQVLMTGGTVGTVDGNEIVDGDIFGGGNAAAVNGNTSVTITGGEVKRNVYGGGNQAAVSGTTNVVIGQ